MKDNSEKTYIGPYKVYKIFRKSNRRKVIKRGLTVQDARDLVNSFPDSTRSIVVYSKQFSADKYFKP